MKNYYPLLFSLLSLFLVGCTSYYTARQYSSPKEFYEDFNDFAKNKNLKVTLRNDSTFITDEGTQVLNDSLILINKFQKTEIKVLQLKEIKSINDFYDADSNHLFKIILRDGKELDEKEIKFLPDSSIQILITNTITSSYSIPLSKVKEVKYNRRWLGIPFGSLTGALLGTIAGAVGIIPVYESHPNFSGGQTWDIETGGAMIVGFGTGTIIGGILGWLIGYDYIYVFNN